jgi:hypothetical protein
MPAHPRGRARAEVRGVRRPRGRHRHRHHPADRQPATRCSTSVGSRRCCPRPSRCPTSAPSPTSGSRPTSSRSARPPRAPDRREPHPPRPDQAPVRARGARDRRRHRRDQGLRPRARAPHQDRGLVQRPNVDPVGACVGARGARVRMVVNELRGEKIDIVPFSDDLARLRGQGAVAGQGQGGPDRRDTGTAEVIVPDYQLSLAIGKEGQNARLAARLTGWRVDIKSETRVLGPDGTARLDPAGAGRGAWLCGPECLDRAVAARGFDRAWRTTAPATTQHDLARSLGEHAGPQRDDGRERRDDVHADVSERRARRRERRSIRPGHRMRD